MLHQIIKEAILQKLEESYDSDLAEEILSELSEETLQNLEEQILNELSPALLQRYRKKAWDSKDKYDDKSTKSFNRIGKHIYANNQKRVDYHSDKHKEYSNKSRKRFSNIGKVDDKLDKQKRDLRDMPADEFEKKYRMTKAEYERKYKKHL